MVPMIEVTYYPKPLDCRMSKGNHANQAVHTELTFRQLVDGLSKGQIRRLQAGNLDIPLSSVPKKIYTKNYAVDHPGTIARSKEFMKKNRNGDHTSQLIYIDIDSSDSRIDDPDKLYEFAKHCLPETSFIILGSKSYWRPVVDERLTHKDYKGEPVTYAKPRLPGFDSLAFDPGDKSHKLHLILVMDKPSSKARIESGLIHRLGLLGFGWSYNLRTVTLEGKLTKPQGVRAHDMYDVSMFEPTQFADMVADPNIDPVLRSYETDKNVTIQAWSAGSKSARRPDKHLRDVHDANSLRTYTDAEADDAVEVWETCPQSKRNSGRTIHKGANYYFDTPVTSRSKPFTHKGVEYRTLGELAQAQISGEVPSYVTLDAFRDNALEGAASLHYNKDIGSHIFTEYESGQTPGRIIWVRPSVVHYKTQYAPMADALKAMTSKRLVLKSPTGSGKNYSSLIECKRRLDEKSVRLVIITTPTTSLVHDLKDYTPDHVRGLNLDMPDINIRVKGDEQEIDLLTMTGVVVMTLAKAAGHLSGLTPDQMGDIGVIFDEYDEYFAQSPQTVRNVIAGENDFYGGVHGLFFADVQPFSFLLLMSATGDAELVPADYDSLEFTNDEEQFVSGVPVMPLARVLDMRRAFIVINSIHKARVMALFLLRCGRSVRFFKGKAEIDPVSGNPITKLDLVTDSDYVITTEVVKAGVSIMQRYSNLIIYQNVRNTFDVRGLVQMLARLRLRDDLNMFIVHPLKPFKDSSRSDPQFSTYKASWALNVSIEDYNTYMFYDLARKGIMGVRVDNGLNNKEAENLHRVKAAVTSGAIISHHIGQTSQYYADRKSAELANFDIFESHLLEHGYTTTKPADITGEDYAFELTAGLLDEELAVYKNLVDRQSELVGFRKECVTHLEYDQFLAYLRTFPKASLEADLLAKSDIKQKETGAYVTTGRFAEGDFNLIEEVQVRSRWDTNLITELHRAEKLYKLHMNDAIEKVLKKAHTGCFQSKKALIALVNTIQRRRIPACPTIKMDDPTVNWVDEIRKFLDISFYTVDYAEMDRVNRNRVGYGWIRGIWALPEEWKASEVKVYVRKEIAI